MTEKETDEPGATEPLLKPANIKKPWVDPESRDAVPEVHTSKRFYIEQYLWLLACESRVADVIRRCHGPGRMRPHATCSCSNVGPRPLPAPLSQPSASWRPWRLSWPSWR